MASLASMYPWIHPPLVASAPMRIISTAPMAASVSLGHGFGFIGSGSDVSSLKSMLAEAQSILKQNGFEPNTAAGTLPIGVGLLLWGAKLPDFIRAISSGPPPAAVWLFAPRESKDLEKWADAIRDATGWKTHIWVQVGSVTEAKDACKYAQPEVLVIQGIDAGGHGLSQGAGIVSLVPEVCDALRAAGLTGPNGKGPKLIAAGGIADGRGVAAALALGAEGVALGTRYLASPEAAIKAGYRDEVLRASDGGQCTVRSKVYDTLRGTTDWPVRYGGRGVTNKSYDDWMRGMGIEENKKLYQQAESEKGDAGWGPEGRMTTYAGTAVGIVKQSKSAKDITEEVRGDCRFILNQLQR